jgi:hypothetical protein
MPASIFAAISSFQMVRLRKNHKAIFHVKIHGLFFRMLFWFFLIHYAKLKLIPDSAIECSSTGSVSINSNEFLIKQIIDSGVHIQFLLE